MATEDTASETASDAASTTPAAPAEEPTLPEPTLNREQRRAQAKGKKGATPGFSPTHPGNQRFGGGRPTNAPIQSKIPRTGHK